MRVGQQRKRDANEMEIADALKAIGVLVYRISAPGLPDLLTWDARKRSGHYWLPIEIKRHRPRRSLSDRHGKSLTPAQCVTYAMTKFPIVETIDEALALFGVK